MSEDFAGCARHFKYMCWEVVIAAVVCLDCRVLSFANSIVDVERLNLYSLDFGCAIHAWLAADQPGQFSPVWICF